MKTSSSGITMVAVALGVMALVPACGTEADSGDIQLQDPVKPFAALQGNEGDSTKACASRPDLLSSFTMGAGSWGSWAACYQLCPAGSYGYAVTLKSESPQGAGDDTALNGIQIDCYNKNSGAYTGFITSGESPWGSWRARAVPNPYVTTNPFIGGQMQIESPQGVGDDSSANRVNLKALNGNFTLAAAATAWGSWQPVRTCAAGQAICGVNTRIEGSQGGGDDTALNGIALACCSF